MKREYTNSVHWYCDRFIDSMKRTSSPNTAKRYRFVVEDFLDHHKEKHFAEEFHRWDITDFREDRLREGTSPSTINLELAILRAFFNWLAERELATFNPASKPKLLRVPERRPRGLSRGDVDKLIAACESTRDKLIILMALTTGMRAIEMARLQWIDIDWENNLFHLDGERTKTGGSRDLPLRSDVKELLLEFMDMRRKTVFPCRTGDGSPRRIQDTFTAIVKRAELYPRPTFHAMRHTFAAMLLRSGLDIYTVQKLLGHKNIKTTAIYLSPAGSDDVRSRIANLPA